MAEGFNKGFPVSWDQLHRDGRALAWRLAEIGPFKGIASITRGGLVPAAIVARELEIRLVDTICVASYDHQDQSEITVIKGLVGDGEGWLIIDDLVELVRLKDELPVYIPAPENQSVSNSLIELVFLVMLQDD